jgi:hypothetical protein
MSDFWAGFIMCFIWWMTHSFVKRFMQHEVWVDKYELQRLYAKEQEFKSELWKVPYLLENAIKVKYKNESEAGE